MPTVLFLITSDPRTSHRPAEAIRIAAGLSAWQKVTPLLYFGGPAALAGRGETSDFVDEELYERHLGAFTAKPGSVLVAEESSTAAAPRENVRAVSVEELAQLAREAEYVLHF